MLEVEDLRVYYDKVEALRGLDVHVEENEVVGIIGPNGAGKTTFSNAVTGFKPYEGSVTYRGREVSGQEHRRLVESGLIYCTERRDLFGFMSVEDNLTLGSYVNHEDTDERLEFVYGLFPRLEERRGQDARTLSGGEQQMLAIARVLVSNPSLLLIDEPTEGLMPTLVTKIEEIVETLNDDGHTILLVEQNSKLALDASDRAYIMEKGKIKYEGASDDLANEPEILETYLALK